jgi:hypothetical protein
MIKKTLHIRWSCPLKCYKNPHFGDFPLPHFLAQVGEWTSVEHDSLHRVHRVQCGTYEYILHHLVSHSSPSASCPCFLQVFSQPSPLSSSQPSPVSSSQPSPLSSSQPSPLSSSQPSPLSSSQPPPLSSSQPSPLSFWLTMSSSF